MKSNHNQIEPTHLLRLSRTGLRNGAVKSLFVVVVPKHRRFRRTCNRRFSLVFFPICPPRFPRDMNTPLWVSRRWVCFRFTWSGFDDKSKEKNKIFDDETGSYFIKKNVTHPAEVNKTLQLWDPIFSFLIRYQYIFMSQSESEIGSKQSKSKRKWTWKWNWTFKLTPKELVPRIWGQTSWI